MQLFIDTANLDQIKKYAELGIIDGVTTNPSLIAKEGVDYKTRIREILKVINGPISVEVTTENFEEMLSQARDYATWHENIYVKLPMTENGLKACRILSQEGIKINMTLIFQPMQALLAAKAGAAFISPFIGRLDDISQDGMQIIAEIMEIFVNYQIQTKILVASTRHPRHIVDAARIGADIATIPPEVLEKLIKHPLTDIGQEKFMSDYKKSL
ncbi:fructose-6-phosphate aldolase [Candidatus Peregrinibacteria bacterium RIFOXYA2_FULL_33_7]|nr:MAG: fructose-6-phosphate aldolase [Candidatus Peregrinibacteria bacterium RIFOXYA2_FULL_33_7]